MERSRAVAQAADIVIMVVDAVDGWQEEDTLVLQALMGGGGGNGVGSDGEQEEEENTGVVDVGGGDEEGMVMMTARGSNIPPALLVINKVDLQETVVSGDGINGNAHSRSNIEQSDGNSPPSPPASPPSSTNVASAYNVPAACRAAFVDIVATSALEGRGVDALGQAVLKLAGAPELAAGGGVAWAVNERQAEALTRAHEALQRALLSVEADLPLDFWTIDLRYGVVMVLWCGDDVHARVCRVQMRVSCLCTGLRWWHWGRSAGMRWGKRCWMTYSAGFVLASDIMYPANLRPGLIFYYI